MKFLIYSLFVLFFFSKLHCFVEAQGAVGVAGGASCSCGGGEWSGGLGSSCSCRWWGIRWRWKSWRRWWGIRWWLWWRLGTAFLVWLSLLGLSLLGIS
ncbi:hypothetical protein HNY73_000996 [Argiope bruennichi]|uniref:Uncharacterized protein n=1 Tax=Argiope bruennichi TaxID=94029 RepID=A0A8T0G2C1_ARGBR|nr:hypothetical protein HNY73_000996 [Argiope bruennichi]